MRMHFLQSVYLFIFKAVKIIVRAIWQGPIMSVKFPEQKTQEERQMILFLSLNPLQLQQAKNTLVKYYSFIYAVF